MARRLIAVDVGNTSTAVGLWSAGRVVKVSHCDGGFAEASQAVLRLEEEFRRSRGKRHLAASRTEESLPLAYASVVPKEDAKWRAFARRGGLRLAAVTPERFPLRLDYPDPSTIGPDRLADAAGAVERYGAPVLVMDFGTALTAAVVTSDRVWRGGVIAPGFPLMRDYLFERTAKLPKMKIGSGRAPKIGRTTEEAMRFGAIVGYRGMVREIVAELKRNFREDFRLVATGGFARWALRDAGLDFTIDPTLTLYGTGLICSKELF